MANLQVRLDAENAEFVSERAYDWDCSLSAATNRLLREARDGKPKAKLAKPAGRVPRSAKERVEAILRANRG